MRDKSLTRIPSFLHYIVTGSTKGSKAWMMLKYFVEHNLQCLEAWLWSAVYITSFKQQFTVYYVTFYNSLNSINFNKNICKILSFLTFKCSLAWLVLYKSLLNVASLTMNFNFAFYLHLWCFTFLLNSCLIWGAERKPK